jgi:anti-sigma regulatory factor (Ser/Thr protein kinase)
MPATPDSVGLARRIVTSFASDLEVDLEGIALAVSEAVANAIAHGYPEGDAGLVELSAGVSPFVLTITVRDHGCGLANGSSPSGAGFGLTIIRRVAQHVELTETVDGVSLTMAFPRGGTWSDR